MSTLNDLFRNENRFDFPRLWKRSMALSAALVVLAFGGLVLRGLNLGIEFEGGASWEVRSPEATAEQLRSALEPLGLGDARIQQVANELWRVRAATDGSDGLEAVKIALAEATGVGADDVTANAVGGSWGSEVTAKARNALIVFFGVLFVYISLRLEWKMAAAALLAVAHDIAITVGVYALFQFEVSSATVVAFLTILGYSLYDTMVVFDKVRENDRRAVGATAVTYTEVTSHSLNQVLMRSVNTTLTSILPVIAVLVVGRLILGAVTLQEFAIALLVGLIVGGYSSIFIAAPLVAWFKEREALSLERRVAAAKRPRGQVLDVGAALDDADRARQVRSSARGGGHRVTAATRERGGSTPGASVVVNKRRNDGPPAEPKTGGTSAGDARAERLPRGEIKPRPPKKSR